MPVRMRTKIRKYFSLTLDQSYVSVGNISGWHVSMGQGLSRLALNSPCRHDVWKTFYFAERGVIYISGGSTDLMSVWYIWGCKHTRCNCCICCISGLWRFTMSRSII